MLFQNRADKLFEQGEEQLQREQYSLAIDTFSKVIKIEGNDAVVSRLNRGVARLHLTMSNQSSGDDEQSPEERLKLCIEDFSIAINRVNSQTKKSSTAAKILAELHYRRAQSVMWLGKFQESIKDMNEAIRQNS
ncbi:MAG: tetratricopeptide repeat protein, partial [Anaerolineales bacterium]|nr:tetratricopeptide repeat protein [Anaerolineales bacterium]